MKNLLRGMNALALTVLVLLAGCGGGKPLAWQEPGIELAWPPPPDVPRIRYLRSFIGPADFRDEGKAGGFSRWLLGSVDEGMPLLTPYAVAYDDFETLWVADNGARMLYRFDTRHGKIEYVQESAGIRLVSPSGVIVDNAGRRLFVSDAELAKVLVFDLHGRLLDQWIPPGGFKRPAGLALDSAGRLYAADVLDGTVVIFGADGRFLERRGSLISEGGRFYRPLAVAIGPGGELLVNEAMAFRIEVQDAQGRLLGTIGKLGDVPGTFARPRGVAVSPEGYVFVSDAAFDNVQVFDMAGNLLMHFGSTGKEKGQFNLPAGLHVDRHGRFFVADSYNHRVQVFQIMSAGE